jgi:gluconokinase
LNDTDVLVWNSFVAKVGWNDLATRHLEKLKRNSGLGDPADIETMVEHFEVAGGRRS